MTYFRANGFNDELVRDPKVTWLVAFYAAWSPASINFAPTFSKLSSNYGLPNLKFGKSVFKLLNYYIAFHFFLNREYFKDNEIPGVPKQIAQIKNSSITQKIFVPPSNGIIE